MKYKFLFIFFTIIFCQVTAATVDPEIPSNSFDAAKLKQVMSALWKADAAETDDENSKPIWHVLGPIAAIKKLQKLRTAKELAAEEIPWEQLFAAWFDPTSIPLLSGFEGDVLRATCFVDHFMKGTIPLPVPSKPIAHPAHGGILGWEQFVMFVHDMLHSKGMARNIMKYQPGLSGMFEMLRSQCQIDKKDTLDWALAMYIHELEHHHNIFENAKSDGEIFAAMCGHFKKKFGEELNHQNDTDPTQLPRFAQELAFADAMYQAALQSCINTDELTFAAFIQNLQDLVKLPAIAKYTVTEKTGTENGDTVDVIVALNGQKYLCQTLSRLGARKLMYGDVIRDLIDIKALESDATIESITRKQLVVKWNEVIDSIQVSFATCFSDSTLSDWATQLIQVAHGRERDGDHPLIPVEGCARDFRRHEHAPHQVELSPTFPYPVAMFARVNEHRRPDPDRLQSMHTFVANCLGITVSDAVSDIAAIITSTYGWARMPMVIGFSLLRSQTFTDQTAYARELLTRCKEFGLQISDDVSNTARLDTDNLETTYFKRATSELFALPIKNYDGGKLSIELGRLLGEICEVEMRQQHCNATDRAAFLRIVNRMKHYNDTVRH